MTVVLSNYSKRKAMAISGNFIAHWFGGTARDKQENPLITRELFLVASVTD